MSDTYDDLTILSCEACRAGAPQIEQSEIERLMPSIPEWEIVEIDDERRLRRTFKFDGWTPAVAFTNAVAEAAEQNDHHPYIELEWGRVQVSWWTHKIGGLHKNDFIMAAKTDAIAASGQ